MKTLKGHLEKRLDYNAGTFAQNDRISKHAFKQAKFALSKEKDLTQ